jgi:hypothetical protein
VQAGVGAVAAKPKPQTPECFSAHRPAGRSPRQLRRPAGSGWWTSSARSLATNSANGRQPCSAALTSNPRFRLSHPPGRKPGERCGHRIRLWTSHRCGKNWRAS